MKEKTYTIGELADAAGITRRAVHFYVQRGLLQRPDARGRGATYSPAHLDRLRQILRLQQAGHSLAAIARLIEAGVETPEPQASKEPEKARLCEEAAPYRIAARPVLPSTHVPEVPPGKIASQLLMRVRIGEGIELVLDAAKHNPSGQTMVAIRAMLLQMLNKEEGDN